MFVKLTNAANRTTLFLRQELIRSVEKSARNPLVTAVITNMMTPQGPMAYEVTETQEEVVRLIECAATGKSSILQ